MRQQMKDRYKSNTTYRSMQNMRCAMKIKRKNKGLNRQTEESDNSLIKETISVFRSQIKAGPTYVCTVCHKASFPNQVKTCKRLNYVKNPHMVAACLTGKYVHVCDDECRDEQQCNVPDERREEWICHTCHNHLKDGVMPTLAVANNLELADIPPELCDLNILERHLIAKCIAFAKIIPLPKGRQRAIHGNVVCVPSEVQETVEALPRLRSESQVMRVKLKRRLCYRGHQLFQTVTWSKLVQALHKLKRIHPQYQDITIRDEAELCDPTLPDDEEEDEDATMNENDYDDADLKEIDMCEKSAMCETETELDGEQDVDMLSCDGEQPEEQRDDEEQEGDMPNGGFALESCLQPCDVSEEILCFSEGIYSVAPAESNSPVGFFKTPKLEAMAFPVQFPTGQNTLDEGRRIKVTPSSYFKARLFCVDDRFARDTNYLFFAQFVTEIHLATSSMTIQLRKGKPMTRDGRKITSGMLQNKREVEKLVRNKDAVRFMQPLRGTPAYWEKTTRDLFAMIRQLGTPTFFCSNHHEYVKHIVKRNKDKYEKNSEEIENAVEEFEQNRGVIDEWCNLAPESEVDSQRLTALKLPSHSEEVDISNPTVLLTAFTGTAAFNISGSTLHSLLKLPRSLKPPFQGLGNQLDEIRSELLNAEILVIDEVSMVSKPLFAYVDARLKQIKGSPKPFGGMSVIAVGDFYQLPPVRQSKTLCVYEPCEIDLWQEQFQTITLTEIMRQKDDVAFAEMLNRIRVKGKSEALSQADRALLSQTITEPSLCPPDVLHIFATNKQVDSHNSVTLSLLHSNITKIDADDYKKDPQTGRMARQDKPYKGNRNELPDTLGVAEGARIMLTRNIDVSQGLVNGSFSTLVRVITSEQSGVAHVTMLGLKMDDETAGRNYRNRAPGRSDDVVYIERAEDNLKQKGVVHRQFPVRLAFASISRVTSLSGLHMLDLDESKIYANPEITGALQTMRQVNLDDMMPLLRIKQTSSRRDTLTIVHHVHMN
ncbi:uncharacterized protein LOC134036985 [Osmerus eperlanus]|uniref:uncharacterized protein LOC134036985 n=1 Tax=Osmerus eperlanus TaxID=29151 RepID=UPI002E15F5F9